MQNKSGDTHRKIVVPNALKNKILQMGHDTIMSKHQGIKRTYDRIVSVLMARHVW